jgi:hypothetical protein
MRASVRNASKQCEMVMQPHRCDRYGVRRPFNGAACCEMCNTVLATATVCVGVGRQLSSTVVHVEDVDSWPIEWVNSASIDAPNRRWGVSVRSVKEALDKCVRSV